MVMIAGAAGNVHVAALSVIMGRNGADMSRAVGILDSVSRQAHGGPNTRVNEKSVGTTKRKKKV